MKFWCKSLLAGLLFLFLFTVPFGYGQTGNAPQLQTGDLLFQDLDCGALCDAIEAVTDGRDGKEFSHVGMAYIQNDSVYVIEAIGDGVSLTPLAKFLERSTTEHGQTKVLVERLTDSMQFLIPEAVAFAKQQLGKPYDDVYLPNNGKYYCSELLYDAFQHANGGEAIFQLQPMTFKDPNTNLFVPAWVEHYKELGVAIPEGQPGCNPGGLSRSQHLNVVYSYYDELSDDQDVTGRTD